MVIKKILCALIAASISLTNFCATPTTHPHGRNIMVASDKTNTRTLCVLLQYKGYDDFYYYYKLEKGASKKIDFKRDGKRLTKIRVQASPIMAPGLVLINDGETIREKILPQALSTQDVNKNATHVTFRILNNGRSISADTSADTSSSATHDTPTHTTTESSEDSTTQPRPKPQRAQLKQARVGTLVK